MTQFYTVVVSTEGVITLLRLTGVLTFILAIICFVRMAILQNALPVTKAKQFIEESARILPETAATLPLEDLSQHPMPGKKKKPLVLYSLSPEAMDLLKKLSVLPSTEGGWEVNAKRLEDTE